MMNYIYALIYLVSTIIMCGELYHCFINRRYKKNKTSFKIKRITAYFESIPFAMILFMLLYIIAHILYIN